MRNGGQLRDPQKGLSYFKFRNLCRCLRSGEQLRVNEMTVDPLDIRDYSASINSSPFEETGRKRDTGNIQEAETSLRESHSLNYEEARALLGRYEYQKGNIEAALHVFEGIDISSVTPEMRVALSRLEESCMRPSQSYESPSLSIHAVGLLFEAMFLKAKCLQASRRYKEAAQSCSVILDTVESSLPDGLPSTLGADSKLQEIINKAVELLPELWKSADSPRDATLSYRRALLQKLNLDTKTTAKIQKDFAIFLLYSEAELISPNLRSQTESAFVPKNNIEEAILLLMILLRKATLKKIEWDPSILDHLSYALSISGGLKALASQVEELLPGTIDEKETYHTLALCYLGDGDDSKSFDSWEKMLRTPEGTTHLQALLFIAKICGGTSKYGEDGIKYAQRAIENLSTGCGCDQSIGAAYLLLGLSCSASSRTALTDSQRDGMKSEAIKYLELAGEMTKLKDPIIVYNLCLEYAEQRKLNEALHYSKIWAELEGGSSVSGCILMARILSAQKRFLDAETVINEALDRAGIWDQGVLLRTKAKLQLAMGLQKESLKTYSHLAGIIQVHRRNFGSSMKHKDRRKRIDDLEIEMWYDLALIYMELCKLKDSESCISKLEAIRSSSPLNWHAQGLLREARDQLKEAIKAYHVALSVDPEHVPSLVSMAEALRKEGSQSATAIVRSFLTEALRLDRMNARAWYNLGLLYRDGGGDGFCSSAVKAAECFQACDFIQETEPVEPFR